MAATGGGPTGNVFLSKIYVLRKLNEWENIFEVGKDAFRIKNRLS